MTIRYAALSIVLVTLAGCAGGPQRDPAFAPTVPVAQPEPPVIPTGAIYRTGYDMRLFEDARARRVGDILTITLVERTDASKSSSADAARSTNMSVDDLTLFGSQLQFGLPGAFPLADTNNNTFRFNLDANSDFSGEGSSAQRNMLEGTITVTVAEVLPNGNLVVRGEKLVTLHEGSEVIQIAGIVRPADILPDNTVPSTRVANVQMRYEGQEGSGAVVDASTLGWLGRFFLSVLFPF